jgi:hypothetical protein
MPPKFLEGIAPKDDSGFGAASFIEPAIGLGMLGVSLFQQREAQRRLRNLQQPTAPLPTRNELLSGRISQAQREAELGSPALRREADASAARSTEQARQVASQLGGATYGAMMQQQAANTDAGRRDAILQDEMLRMRRQQQLDQLIGMRSQENQFADQMGMQQYQNQFANFAQQQRGLMGDIAQGTTNVLASGAYTAQGVGGLFDQYRKYKALNQEPVSTFKPTKRLGRVQMDYQQEPLNINALGGMAFTPQPQALPNDPATWTSFQTPMQLPSMRTTLLDPTMLPPRPKK